MFNTESKSTDSFEAKDIGEKPNVRFGRRACHWMLHMDHVKAQSWSGVSLQLTASESDPTADGGPGSDIMGWNTGGPRATGTTSVRVAS